jgi:hypothetical protein
VREPPLLVDPAVSRAKFAREVEQFRALADDHARNGCWLVKAEFPRALVVFGTPKARPPAVAFAAAFDFTNYDLWPPSVRLVNPFTQTPYKTTELPTALKRQLPPSPEQAAQGVTVVQTIMQSYGPDEVPFVCLPGVREYHEHPGHSGDSWLLRRGRGEGTLHNLVTHLYHYGTEYVSGFQIVINVGGFSLSEIPA